ncbi:MAG: sodium-dependent transporter [Clostridia bacterium]|nr:sodium-dependent transporter [Clostridia bacterium]
MERERLGSRLGFILLSAGCAIGVGNVWKFPWLCGENGGGIFVLLYILFLVLLGLPVMVMEFSLGRASQSSPVGIYQKLQKPGQKWHIHGYFALGGNVILMMFYTSVTGWILYYFIKFLNGDLSKVAKDASMLEGEKLKNITQASEAFFGDLLSDPIIMVGFVAIVVVLGFLILSFGLQNGVERVTKYMMIVLLFLMIVLAGYSFTLDGAKEGLTFYLKPDFSKISGSIVVNAMNQAFFTLSLGIGSMAIFGSYLGKERSLMGESINILILDTFVAITAGLIIFPACHTYGIEPGAGPSLLFETMTTVFSNMESGRIWGSLFFLFMFFAAMSTIIAVSQNILACVQELTHWGRIKTCILCGIGILILSVPCALGFNLLSDFAPFKSGSSILDLEDFIVSNCLLPLGALCYVLFCVSKKGWGFENFMAEANTGKGLKIQKWMRGYMTYVIPVAIILLFFIGILTFEFADNFTIWNWFISLF